MPKSNKADVRIRVIDRCLSDKNRCYSTAETHGQNMWVIEPLELKERIQKRLAEATNNYSKSVQQN